MACERWAAPLTLALAAVQLTLVRPALQPFLSMRSAESVFSTQVLQEFYVTAVTGRVYQGGRVENPFLMPG